MKDTTKISGRQHHAGERREVREICREQCEKTDVEGTVFKCITQYLYYSVRVYVHNQLRSSLITGIENMGGDLRSAALRSLQSNAVAETVRGMQQGETCHAGTSPCSNLGISESGALSIVRTP